VANRGSGRFSDWGNSLVFSAPDNGNPRQTAHIYTASFRVYPSQAADGVVAAVTVLAAWVTAECSVIFSQRLWRRPATWTPAQRRYAIITAGTLGVVEATLYFLVLGINVHAPLPSNGISFNEGKAYGVSLPHRDAPLLTSYSDDSPEGSWSNLALFEDDTALGPPHSVHATIRAEGLGAYSHWGDGLFFSSSDGSDPRTNGRTYRAVYRVFLVPRVALSLLMLSGAATIAKWLPWSTWRGLLPWGAEGPRGERYIAGSGATANAPRHSSLLRFGGLVALYTVVLLLLYGSLVARETDTGALSMNFEYKVF